MCQRRFIIDKDYIIIVIQWIAAAILLLRYVPRDKIRLAHVAFLFKQVITWVSGLATVELRFIVYPVRLFPYANKTSFTFEYFVYPAICAVFNVNYPEKKGKFGQFMYYFYYCTVLTIIEVITERYTNVLKYVHWTWYTSWISFFISFYMTRKYCEWFKLKEIKN